MTNEQAITEKAVRFEMETGKHPTKLYLGWKTHKDVFDRAAEFMTHKQEPPVTRANYQGMDVYRVDEENYIEVGV